MSLVTISSPPRRFVAAAVVLVVLALPVLHAPPAEAQNPDRYRNQAIAATNHQRVAHDRVRVRKGACLQGFARRQAVRMANQERMFHQNLRRVLRRCHLTLVGENVAVGYPNGWAVVNQGWMTSKPHRRNLLDRRHRWVGIAARRGDNGRWYVAQVLGRH